MKYRIIKTQDEDRPYQPQYYCFCWKPFLKKQKSPFTVQYYNFEMLDDAIKFVNHLSDVGDKNRVVWKSE